MRARVLKLILLRSDLEKGDARFVSGWHKALSMSRLRFGYMLKSAAPATSESDTDIDKDKNLQVDCETFQCPNLPGTGQAKLYYAYWGWLLASAILIAVCLLLWGQHFLVAISPVPQHVDAAVVLQGLDIAEKCELPVAINFLQRESPTEFY